MSRYTCYRCDEGPCDIQVKDGSEKMGTIPRILDDPKMNICPVEATPSNEV
jgi:hypothetical protein